MSQELLHLIAKLVVSSAFVATGISLWRTVNEARNNSEKKAHKRLARWTIGLLVISVVLTVAMTKTFGLQNTTPSFFLFHKIWAYATFFSLSGALILNGHRIPRLHSILGYGGTFGYLITFATGMRLLWS